MKIERKGDAASLLILGLDLFPLSRSANSLSWLCIAQLITVGWRQQPVPDKEGVQWNCAWYGAVGRMPER